MGPYDQCNRCGINRDVHDLAPAPDHAFAEAAEQAQELPRCTFPCEECAMDGGCCSALRGHGGAIDLPEPGKECDPGTEPHFCDRCRAGVNRIAAIENAQRQINTRLDELTTVVTALNQGRRVRDWPAPTPPEYAVCDDEDCVFIKPHARHWRAIIPSAIPLVPDAPSELRKRALSLFRPTFRFEMGYVWDAAGEMVADNREDKEDAAALPVLRVRGWGRIKYLPEPDALHDEAGRLIAEALTKGWPR